MFNNSENSEVANTILKSAQDILSKSGAARFSVRSVAVSANISLGHLQHYFKNKDDLLDNLMIFILRGYERKLKKVTPEAATDKEKLAIIVKTWFDDALSTESSQLFFHIRSLAQADARGHARIKMLYDWNLAKIQRLVADIGVDRTESEARFRAIQIAAMLDGISYYIVNGDLSGRQLLELRRDLCETALKIAEQA